MPPSLHIIAASTSGNTEHVVAVIREELAARHPEITVTVGRAETATPQDLLQSDVLILGSGTWNTGGTEGQLNPHMHAFLLERAKDADLGGRAMTFISLGDDRYYQRTRCTEHFLRFQREHNGKLFFPPLVIVNEPYGQEEKIRAWAGKLAARMLSNNTAPAPRPSPSAGA